MTGISRTSVVTDSFTNNRQLARTKMQREIHRFSNDDSEMNLRMERAPKSRFGKLLRRSLSLVNITPPTGKGTTGMTSQPPANSDIAKISPETKPTSREDSNSDSEEITNAFFFGKTPEDTSSFTEQQEDIKNQLPMQKTIVKSVKVTRVHSQKSPHIRHAARKLSRGKSLHCEGTFGVASSAAQPLRLKRSSSISDAPEEKTTPKIEETCCEEESLGDTLPFTIDSMEDLEVEAINANAPVGSTPTTEQNTNLAHVAKCTQELAEYLKRSVYHLNALEDLDLKRSEKFCILYQDLSTLDDRLVMEFSPHELEDDWSIGGPFTADDARETLLHFASRFVLPKLCKQLLTLPGAEDLLNIPNQSGLLPSDIAIGQSSDELVKLFNAIPNKEWGSGDELVSNTPAKTPEVKDMATSNPLGLDANIDMLHQLIEEIEVDRKAAMDVDSTDVAPPRRVYSGSEHNPLDSIPETAAVDFADGDGDVRVAAVDGNSAVDSPASLILPYSETSSDAESDSSEPPALPPRTWRRNDQQAPLSVSPIALGLGSAYATNPLTMKCTISGEDSLPSITVSPPRSRISVGALHESIEMAKECREEVDGIRHNQSTNDSMTLKRFSTSCPSLEDQGMYDGTASSVGMMQPRQARGQYKSLLDVTQEENEDEVKAATAETLLNTHRPCGERPKSLDFSTLGAKLSLAGVTGASSATDVDDESFADRNRKVSFNMFGGGAQKEKTKFHQGVESAGKRSFSLGSLGSEDDEDEQRTRIRERSADSDGHVKPIDIYGAPLQKLPNVDFSKHMSQQSDGSTSSLHSSSQEQLNRQSLTAGSRHSQQVRSALPLPQTHITTNLNKSKSVSTPSIHQAGDQTPSNRHSGLFHTSHTKVQHNTDSLRRAGPRRPLSQDQEHAGGSPSNYEDDDKKSKKGGRRTSVFAKFGSVRKTGKSKDKNEVKRASHNFIAVNLPTSTCNHCSRPLSYKPAVQCSNCLMNYHDECKDKVLSCPKQKRERKAPVVQSLANQPNRHEPSEGIMSPSIGDSYSPSMESLADDGNADDEYEDDPELAVASTEAESWSETIDKKVLKSYKTKYVQRQDNIWELIATEKQYCVNLKIMQKVFAHGMKNECMLPDSAINRIFPQLDELIDLHQSFLASLQDRQCNKPDKSVDVIGDVIVDHFGGTAGERMKRAYGVFCSRHKEGIDYYKQLYKADRKFQTFIKKVSNLSCTKRRGVQDLVTVVTMRMTKYKTLIENIIKNTKDSKDKADKETLHKALDLNKDILRHIDMSIHNRNQELRLLEIYNKMDSRSAAVYDKIKKFKKSDLTAKNRKLRHEGVLSWRNAREKEVETLVVVLSDVMLLLQETDKKYTFFTQDNKPSVVPLTSLIVREKGSTKDNRGIYLIRQSRENPEMYELVCKSSQERKEWIDLLRKAVNDCPEEDEGVINETEEEHREVIAKLGKLREYVETLDYKDKELEKCCRERFSIIADIMQVYDYTDVLQNIKSCYDDDDELKSASELIKLSLDEASMLASLYQTVPSSTNLGRSWSSVGERHSPTYQQIPLPKRAETFNGFDQDIKSPAAANRTLVDKGDAEGRTPSLLNLHQDNDCEGTPDSNARTETSRSVNVNRRSSSNILHQLLSTTNSSSRQDEAESYNESLLATSNMLAITAIIPPSKEQAQCVAQLNEYLHGILLVINKQDSMLEHTKQQLADLTVRSRRIEQEQEKKSALRHNKQMEEIRNRHEQLKKERASLEAEKESLNAKLEKERAEMDFLRDDMANQQNELKKEREELQRQREALQKQVDFYHQARGEQTGGSPSRTPHLSPQSSSADLDITDSSANSKTVEVEMGHKRSHSADLIDNAQMFMDSRYTASLTEPLNMKEMRAQHLANSSTSPDRQVKTSSAGNLSKMDKNSSQGSLKKMSNNNTVQQIPSKLVAGQTSKTSTASNQKSMLPLNLAESSRKGARNSKEHSAKTPGQGKKSDVIYF